MVWTSHPVDKLRGNVTAPGDKSCSHRALILGAIAEGETLITGLLEGADVLATGAAMRALGASIEQTKPGEWRIIGVGPRGLGSAGVLDFGNSGTGSRLVMGAVTGYTLIAEFTGDDSLSTRPMNRILEPLRLMGLRDTADEDGHMPFTLYCGDGIKAIDYTPPHASAQIKSAILLAGLNAQGTTIVRESRKTRDHSERMLRGFGAEVVVQAEAGGGNTVSIEGGQALRGIETTIPGDPSSAAFLASAAMISPDGEILIEGVMSNETRDGFFTATQAMGAVIGAEERGEASGERLIDMSVSSSGLKGSAVPARLVPSMIDEFPILAVMAAFAKGETVVTGAKELRVKETDRIKAIVDMLRVNGVKIEEREDGFVIEGCNGPPPGGGLVETRGDHRIAMSALIMGTASQRPVSIDDASMIATSYPDFLAHMAKLGADMREE